MAAGLLFLAALDVANAASSACVRLESRLAALQSGSSGGGRAASFDTAISEQRRELDVANADARRAGCKGGFLFFQSTPSPGCPSLMRSIGRMEANLGKLMSQRQRYSVDPADAARQRSIVMQQLAANNCGPQYTASAQPRSFLQQLFNPNGQYTPPPEQRSQAAYNAASADSGYSGGGGFGRGSYRTVCVRTCDGSFFPINFAASRSSFSSDEAACQAQCPGTDVSLYAYRNPGESIEQARSTADDTLYTDLAQAFAYRSTFHPSCTCGKASSLDAVAGGYTPVPTPGLTDIEAPAGDNPPVPTAKPAPGEDPETLANRAGGLDPGQVGKPNMTVPVAGLTPLPHGAVRRVGPSYYYAQ